MRYVAIVTFFASVPLESFHTLAFKTSVIIGADSGVFANISRFITLVDVYEEYIHMYVGMFICT